MRFLGFEITRRKAAPATLSSVGDRSGWFRILESFPGAWQTNVEVEVANTLTYAPVFACIRLIASDIGKLRLRLVRRDENGLWTETDDTRITPVLRRPNHFQTRLKFFESWLTAKLAHGNAYILKHKDERGTVRALYVLDPTRVTPMVAPDTSVFYQLQPDNMARLESGVMVPASEIIHDPHICLYHPLVGVSPITACGVSAVEALRIQESSAQFFGNHSRPGGLLTAPGHIAQETADRLKAYWQEQYTGTNAGKLAVLGDGLKYESTSVNAVDAQLIEQLQMTAADVCTAFGVPPYKINVGPMPTYNNISALDVGYYSQVLQSLIEQIEELLDLGLGLADQSDTRRYGVEFDRADLFQMDEAGRVDAAAKTIASGALSPNEARRRYLDAPPVKGGDSPMVQQQYFSLEALAERDSERPFVIPVPAAPAGAERSHRVERKQIGNGGERIAFYQDDGSHWQLVDDPTRGVGAKRWLVTPRDQQADGQAG